MPQKAFNREDRVSCKIIRDIIIRTAYPFVIFCEELLKDEYKLSQNRAKYISARASKLINLRSR